MSIYNVPPGFRVDCRTINEGDYAFIYNGKTRIGVVSDTGNGGDTAWWLEALDAGGTLRDIGFTATQREGVHRVIEAWRNR